MVEIVERNKQAQFAAQKLRRELQDLMEEAVKLGVLEQEQEEGTEVQNVEEVEVAPKSHPLEA